MPAEILVQDTHRGAVERSCVSLGGRVLHSPLLSQRWEASLNCVVKTVFSILGPWKNAARRPANALLSSSSSMEKLGADLEVLLNLVHILAA